jgi:hypothetical protein
LEVLVKNSSDKKGSKINSYEGAMINHPQTPPENTPRKHPQKTPPENTPRKHPQKTPPENTPRKHPQKTPPTWLPPPPILNSHITVLPGFAMRK